jgi:hypothetical protein
MYGKVDFDEVSILCYEPLSSDMKSDGTCIQNTHMTPKDRKHIGFTNEVCSCIRLQGEDILCTCLYSRKCMTKLSNNIIYTSYDFADRYIIHYISTRGFLILIDNYGTLYSTCAIYVKTIQPCKVPYAKMANSLRYDGNNPHYKVTEHTPNDQCVRLQSIYSSRELSVLCIYNMKQISMDKYLHSYISDYTFDRHFMEQYVNCMIDAFPTKQEIKIRYQCINMGPDGYRCKLFTNKSDTICKDCQYLLTLAQTLPCGILKDTDVQCSARSSECIFGLFMCTDCKIQMQSGYPLKICPKFEIKCEGHHECLAPATHIHKIPLCTGHLKRVHY